MDTPNNLLRDRGLPIYGKKKRQLRIGNYGVCDVITANTDYMFGDTKMRHIQINIYELKQKEINNATFFQGVKYIRGVQRWMEQKKPRFYFNIGLVLIGKTINTSNDSCYLPDIMKPDECQSWNISLRMYTYDYRIDGIHFNEHYGYKLTNEGF